MASNTQVHASIDGTTATLTFVTEDRPNVMSTAVLERLEAAVAKVADADNVRFCMLRAEGKVFVAGADIKEMNGFDPAAAEALSQNGNRVMDAIEALPCVTLALIQGAALGGGCEIALACDFRIAVSSAKLGLPETTLGLIPGWGGTKRTWRILGPSAARKLVFSGQAISAAEAASIGLVDEVVDSVDELDAAAQRWRKTFAAAGPRAINMAKRAFRTGDEVAAFTDCFTYAESREGMTAFSEKRKAAWMED